MEVYLPAFLAHTGPVVPVLRFSGPIGVVTPLRPGITLSTSAASIDKAFSMRGASAVAIQINSPGGSPVQSGLIYRRIRALAAEKDLQVYVFAEDVAASGGYLLALAGDEIYADQLDRRLDRRDHAELRLARADQRFGVERRVYTAGAARRCSIRSCRRARKTSSASRRCSSDMHASFIDRSRSGAARRLKAERREALHRRVLDRQAALELGLIDGLADLRSKMRARFGDEVSLKLVARRRLVPAQRS